MGFGGCEGRGGGRLLFWVNVGGLIASGAFITDEVCQVRNMVSQLVTVQMID